ncbi:DUF6351 family protein [Solimonas flava]|uniref:DUF6351 family protein n=1 Tax=Solimonas flava TaxID=415849 RepID=UPI0004809EAB|nr:DUF6351 family protein [Solimonas flava]
MMHARRAAGLAAGLLLLLSACGRSDPSVETGAEVDADFHTLKTPPLTPGQVELLTLSTLPDAVSGGDVRVALRGLSADDTYTVKRGGTDISAAFTRVSDGEAQGLVDGLADGANTIAATVDGPLGARRVALTVRNHPLSGPMISGPHQTPFICRGEEAGLGAPLDADCTVATQLQWVYRSARTQAFETLDDPYAAYPADVIRTVTRDGRDVPFVVRIESTTINRGIARLAVLDDPAARGADAPFDAGTWDHGVYYVFGESCGPGYQQGVSTPNYVLGAFDLSKISADNLLINLVGIADRLGKGDLIVHNTLSAFGNHCNPMVSLETAMMTKEYIGDHYGVVARVVGTNGSGAALQQYNAINNAPGLLSAAMPTATFADILSTAMTVGDCGLLEHYYATTTLGWSATQKAAVDGHNLLSGTPLNSICASWVDAFLPLLDPKRGCDGSVPEDIRYDAQTNPQGVRCTLQDGNVNIFGRDPKTGFARRPLDNTGVQYGLQALRDGTISAAQFLDVNRRIGGFGIDGDYIDERMRMDPELAQIAYRIGGVIGRGALAETPVLDHAPYLDLIPVANIHESVRPFTVRARLDKYSGQTATQGIWRGVVTQADGYPVVEQWLDTLDTMQPPYSADAGAAHMAAVTAAKPAAANDHCVFGTVGGRLELPDAILLPLGLAQLPLLPSVEPLYELVPGFSVDVPLRVNIPEDFGLDGRDAGVCGLALPVVRTPRMVAGMPMSDDIIRCQLRAIDPADYDGKLDDAQLAELRAIFPDGVCDFSKPAAEDVAHSLLWPSLGGARLESPHGLRWRVARSK